MIRDNQDREGEASVKSSVESVALRESANQLIEELGRNEIASYLRKRIAEVTNYEERIDLIASYALLEKEEAFDVLRTLATQPSEPNVIRIACYYWLAKIDQSRAVWPIVLAMSNSDPNFRIGIVKLAAVLPRPDGIQLLINALKDSSNEVQAVAASALIDIGAFEKIEVIIKYFNDHPTSPDAERARTFIEKVKAKADKYEDWWDEASRQLYGGYE